MRLKEKLLWLSIKSVPLIGATVGVIGYNASRQSNDPIVRSYGADIAGPFAYALAIGTSNRELGTIQASLFCAFWEFGQLAQFTPGTFDPKDFLAYAAGIAATKAVYKIQDTLEDRINHRFK
jgi:hypothetical protein